MQKKKKIEDCFIKEMKVSCHDLSVGLEVDGNAMTTFDRVERRVSESLYKMMLNSVLGFSGEMQQEMAENHWMQRCGFGVGRDVCLYRHGTGYRETSRD